MALADEKIHVSSTVRDLAIATQALEKAEQLMAEQESAIQLVDVRIRYIKACVLITENEPDPAQRMAWIRRGIDVGASIQKESPRRVEGYYYQAALKGRHAEMEGGVRGFLEVGEVEELGLKAEKLDASYDDGAPLRLLALLYAKAPSWPKSVGDVDLALEYAEQAVALSDYPLNHYTMAEVLIQAEEFDEARQALQKVLSAPEEGKWARESAHWRAHAETMLTQLQGKP